jgi:hypothetical protein
LRFSTGAFGIGGVLETDVSPRLLVRMDASDVQGAHGSPTVSEAGPIAAGGTPRAQSIQISLGAGVRF